MSELAIIKSSTLTEIADAIRTKKTGSSQIPSQYTMLEYIECTGTQFIDTGFKPNQNTRVVMDFQADNSTCHLFGARTEFLNKSFLVCWSTNFNYCVQVSGSNFNGGTFDEKSRHTVDMSCTSFKVDNAEKATYSVTAFQAEYNLYIASCPSSTEDENMKGKIYSFKIYDNDVVVHDFVPCQKSSGEVGMLDTINNTFYPNAGTGVFLTGTSVDYKPLEYIESTGSEYIDTGYKFGSNKIRIYMEIENLNTVSGASLCGVESESGYASILYSYESGGIFTLHMGVTAHITTIQVPKDGAFHTVEIETFGDGTGQIKVDGITQTFSFTGNVNGSLSFYIGALNMMRSAVDISKQRTRAFKIWDNDICVRDYESKQNIDGIVGLYDKVNDEFYINAGTGGFIAGPEIVQVMTIEETEIELIPVSQMASEILSITTSGENLDSELSTQDDLIEEIIEVLQTKVGNTGPNIDLSGVNATASDVLSPKVFINSSGNKVTGTIQTKSSSDLTVDGAKVTVPAGYYASDVSKSVSTITQAKPSISINSSGLITASTTQSSSGYMVAGTKSDTKQLTTKAATTITPSSSSQTAVASGVYTTGAITVSAIPSTYVKPTYTKSATTYTPTTTNQTISASTYCSGIQTIKGDANLVASNIKSGVSIFGVSGTYTGATPVVDTNCSVSVNGRYVYISTSSNIKELLGFAVQMRVELDLGYYAHISFMGNANSAQYDLYTNDETEESSSATVSFSNKRITLSQSLGLAYKYGGYAIAVYIPA